MKRPSQVVVIGSGASPTQPVRWSCLTHVFETQKHLWNVWNVSSTAEAKSMYQNTAADSLGAAEMSYVFKGYC